MGVTIANVGIFWREAGVPMCGLMHGHGMAGIHTDWKLGPRYDAPVIAALKALGSAAASAGLPGVMGVLPPAGQAWMASQPPTVQAELVAELADWHMAGWMI